MFTGGAQLIQRLLYSSLLCVALACPALAQAEGTQFNGNCTNFTWFQNTELDLAGYKIYDRTSQLVPHTLKATLSSNVVSVLCLSLQFNAGQHYTSISAFDTTGNESPFATDIPFVITLDNQVSDLRVTAIGATDVTLAFTEVAGSSGAPASYDVRYKTPTMDWGTAASVTSGTCATPLAGTTVGATKSCTVTGLSATTPYEFQLVPVMSGAIGIDAVYGPLSNVIGATTGGTIENLGDRTVIVAFAFTQADGALGSPWEGGYSEGSPTNNLTVVSNRVRASSISGDSLMTISTALPNDQWCEVVLTTITGSGVRAPRCLLRVNAPGTINGYEFTALITAGTQKSRIMRWTNGQATGADILANETSTTWVSGDVIRGEARGTGLTLYRNGTLLLTATDSTYSGGRGGIINYSGTSVANVELDDARFGTFAVAGADGCGCN